MRRLVLLVAGVMLVMLSCQPQSRLPDPLAVGSPVPPLEADGWIHLVDGRWKDEGPGTADRFIGAGQVVVIDVWAWWCAPCLESTPELTRIYRKFADQDVVFVGLTGETRDTLPNTREFIKRLRVPWVTGYGAASTILALETANVPTLFIVGRDGAVFWHGYQTDGLEEALRRALEAPGPKG